MRDDHGRILLANPDAVNEWDTEFFEFDGERIRELRIQCDPANYLAKGGR